MAAWKCVGKDEQIENIVSDACIQGGLNIATGWSSRVGMVRK